MPTNYTIMSISKIRYKTFYYIVVLVKIQEFSVILYFSIFFDREFRISSKTEIGNRNFTRGPNLKVSMRRSINSDGSVTG